jgi:hypothetical protein
VRYNIGMMKTKEPERHKDNAGVSVSVIFRPCQEEVWVRGGSRWVVYLGEKRGWEVSDPVMDDLLGEKERVMVSVSALFLIDELVGELVKVLSVAPGGKGVLKAILLGEGVAFWECGRESVKISVNGEMTEIGIGTASLEAEAIALAKAWGLDGNLSEVSQ